MSQAEVSNNSSSQRRQSRDDLIEIDLGQILFALRKRKGFIFFWTAFFTAIAAAYCYVAPPVYRATATLLIENEQNNIVQIKELYGLDSNDQDYFQTQYEMLKSRELAQKVVEKLNLVDNEEFNNQKSVVDDVVLPLIQQLSKVIKTAEAEEAIVRDIQWRLFLLNKFEHQVTGVMGKDTQLAIDDFMTVRQMASKAHVKRAVLRELDKAIAEQKESATATVTDTAEVSAEAEKAILRDVQWNLFLLDRFDGTADGEMTENTQRAIDGFMISRQKAAEIYAKSDVLRELDKAIAEKDESAAEQINTANVEVEASEENTVSAQIDSQDPSAVITEQPQSAEQDLPSNRQASSAERESIAVEQADTANIEVENTASVSADNVGSQALRVESAVVEVPSFEQELLAKLEESSYDEEHIATLAALIGGLDIQPIRKTKLINISFESQSPKMAAFIPNAVGQIYIDDYLQGKDKATDKASEWLVERMEKLEITLRESEQKLGDYKKTNKLIDLDGGVTRYNEQELLSLSSKLLDAKRELAESKALYDEVRRLQDVAPERLENLLAVQSSDIVRTYKVERAEVEREIDELSNKYGDKHPRMLDTLSRLSVISRNIDLEVDRVIGSITNDYELNRANVRSLNSAVSSGKREIEAIGEKGFELSQLQRDVDANRKLYETFFNRYRETDESRSLETTNARISSAAQIPAHSIKPRKSLILAIAFIGSLLAAMMISLMRESFDSSIDTMGGIEKIEQKLGVPLIGIIPKHKAHSTQANKSEPVCPPESAVEGGAFTEAIRTICSSVTLSKKGKANKIIVVTSSVPDEGKSTASVNIAFELAKSEKTLLIDADIRKPSVHKVFGLSPESLGLTHVLQDPSSAMASIQTNVMHSLDVLTAGEKTENPAALFTSDNLEKVLALYGDEYDRIVIDTPPIHAVSDMLYLAKYTDSVIYVVRSESTDMKLVERGLDKLRQVEAPLHGLVIAQVDVEKMKSYGASYYSGYYDYYGYS